MTKENRRRPQRRDILRNAREETVKNEKLADKIQQAARRSLLENGIPSEERRELEALAQGPSESDVQLVRGVLELLSNVRTRRRLKDEGTMRKRKRR